MGFIIWYALGVLAMFLMCKMLDEYDQPPNAAIVVLSLFGPLLFIMVIIFFVINNPWCQSTSLAEKFKGDEDGD